MSEAVSQLKDQVDALHFHTQILPVWKNLTKVVLTSYQESGNDAQKLWDSLYKEMSPTHITDENKKTS